MTNKFEGGPAGPDRSIENPMERVRDWLKNAELSPEEWKALETIVRTNRALSHSTVRIHDLDRQSGDLPDTRVELYSDEDEEPKLVAIVGGRRRSNLSKE